MHSQRRQENGQAPPFRNKRLHRVNGNWYFDSREGTQFGPYRNQADARNALAVYLAQHLFDSPTSDLATMERPGHQDGIAHMVREVFDVLDCYKGFGEVAAENWVKVRLHALSARADHDTFARDCVDVLHFVRDHNEQTFAFEKFLQHQACKL